MPFLAQVIIAVISFALAYILRPKPVTQTSDPDEVDMPSVSEGVEIPVFFGAVWSSDATVVWWGDLDIEETSV